MLRTNAPIIIRQHRDVFPDPDNRFGAPVNMVPSRIVRTTVYVDVCHDKDGSKDVAGLLNAAQVIAMKAEKTHMMECGHRRWDFVNRCKDVRCLDCGHKEPLAEIHKEHLPFKECADRDCPQCDRGE